MCISKGGLLQAGIWHHTSACCRPVRLRMFMLCNMATSMLLYILKQPIQSTWVGKRTVESSVQSELLLGLQSDPSEVHLMTRVCPCSQQVMKSSLSQDIS